MFVFEWASWCHSVAILFLLLGSSDFFARVLQFTSTLVGDGQLINRRIKAVRVNIVSSFYGITDTSS